MDMCRRWRNVAACRARVSTEVSVSIDLGLKSNSVSDLLIAIINSSNMTQTPRFYAKKKKNENQAILS